MFPQINAVIKIDTPSESKPMGRVFLFDFETKQHVFIDGKPVIATYEQAIQQWVHMLLITELDKFEIYKGTGFGLNINHFVGRRDIPVGVINSEVKRQIEENAVKHPEISSIENFTVAREGGKISIAFDVITKQGAIQSGVIVDNG